MGFPLKLVILSSLWCRVIIYTLKFQMGISFWLFYIYSIVMDIQDEQEILLWLCKYKALSR